MANVMFRWCVTLAILTKNIAGFDIGAGSQSISEIIKNSGYTNEFYSLILKSPNLQTMFGGTSGVIYTVFVPTKYAFGNLTREKRQEILGMSSQETDNFVKFYTIYGKQFQINDNTVSDTVVQPSYANNVNKLFLQNRKRTSNIGIGTTGMTQFYVNGAYISEPNKFASNGLVHYIDRVIDISSNNLLYGYLADPANTEISDFSKLVRDNNLIHTDSQFSAVIQEMNMRTKLTMFIPSNEAIRKIPADKLTELQTNTPKFIQMLKSHIILDEVIYTSYLEHNEPFRGYAGTVFMRKNILDQVFVSSQGVVGEITNGNITVANGAVHIVDTMLGYVYYTAMEQITSDNKTLRNYANLIRRGREDVKNFLQEPSGVTVFAPVDTAFTYINNVPGVNLNTDEYMLNMVLNVHLLELGDRLELSRIPGGFHDRLIRPSRYNRKFIMVYNERNETWVQGYHVKARVIRRDVGVENGIIHYIDSVLGIPSQDIPTVIYYEEWLMRSYDELCSLGLVEYLRDPRYNPMLSVRPNNPWLSYPHDPAACSFNRAGTNSGRRVTDSRGACGQINQLCEFTVFVPNGTSISNFQLSPQGSTVMAKYPGVFLYALRRHIIRGKKVYIEDLKNGRSTFIADNGDRVTIYKSMDRYAELQYREKTARILHWDIGATNGVVHIVDPLLFVSEDLQHGASSNPSLSIILFIMTLICTFY